MVLRSPPPPSLASPPPVSYVSPPHGAGPAGRAHHAEHGGRGAAAGAGPRRCPSGRLRHAPRRSPFHLPVAGGGHGGDGSGRTLEDRRNQVGGARGSHPRAPSLRRPRAPGPAGGARPGRVPVLARRRGGRMIRKREPHWQSAAERARVAAELIEEAESLTRTGGIATPAEVDRDRLPPPLRLELRPPPPPPPPPPPAPPGPSEVLEPAAPALPVPVPPAP